MKSGQQFLNYKGLYGDTSRGTIPDFIHSEALATRSRLYNWEIKEHMHSELYQLFLFMEGYGTLFSESRETRFSAPCLITVPVNTLHGFIFNPEVKGDVITLSESYLEGALRNHLKIFDHIQKPAIYQLSQPDKSIELEYLKDRITEELSEVDPERIALLPLLQLLFIAIFRLADTENFERISAKNPSLKIYIEFQRLLRKSIRETRTVNEYANCLGITTVHLNRVCQSIAQSSALKLIHQKIIDEAKKYLLNTAYNISEVGYMLNFHDPAHFTNLFKKYVGVTPSVFRKN